MVKLLGIGKEPIVMSIDNPPKTYQRVSTRPVEEGIFGTEIYKLKSFNKFTQEATYVRQKDQKIKSKENDFTHFPFASIKSNSYQEE